MAASRQSYAIWISTAQVKKYAGRDGEKLSLPVPLQIGQRQTDKQEQFYLYDAELYV
jgi:hypothetical protein